MDPMYLALKMFELRKYDQVEKITTALLEKNPQDEALWTLKMRALTQQVYVDEYEIEYEDVVDQLMDESAMAANPRPGTSLRQPTRTAAGTQPLTTARPMSRRTGRPVSGMLRPSSQATTANMRNAMATGRGLQTSMLRLIA
jgi:tetratricopeptide repeat protein 8